MLGKSNTVIDSDTGEMMLVAIPRRRKHSEPFVMAFLAGAREIANLAQEQRLMRTDLVVLWYLISILDYDNWVQVSPTDVGAELGLRQPHVSRSLKRLTSTGLLAKGPHHTYRFDPSILFRGSEKQRRSVMAEIAKQGRSA